MKTKLISLYKKYEEYINYFIVGVCTTLVSLVSKYLLLFTIFNSDNSFELQLSIVISWIFSVSFAYVTNRKIVFKSKEKNIIKELFTFFATRLSTLFIESLILWFFITLLGLNSNIYVIVWTLVSQVVIFVGNYFLSKYFIFNEKSRNMLSKENAIFIIFLILLFILSYLFPYTHDDWAWGSSIGVNRLTSMFNDYNGRWMGNLFVLLLTRNRILRAIVITFCISGIIIYIKKLLNFKSIFLNLLLIICLLLMPVSILAQAIAWTSGFANYVIVVFLLLIYINYNKELFLDNKKELTNIKNILIYLFLGFCSSLFIEHITIYVVLLSIFFILLSKKILRKFSKINISYMVGTILGSILMFSNNAYIHSFTNKNLYMKFGQENLIISSLKTYFSQLSKYLIGENHFINILVGILCLILIYKYLNSNKKSKAKYIKLLHIVNIYIIIVLGLELYSILLNNFIDSLNIYIKIFNGVIYGFYWIVIFGIVCLLVTLKKIKFRMLFELGSIVIITFSLLIVDQIGPRCFFPTYIFGVIFAMELFNYVFSKKIKKFENANNLLKGICIMLLVINISIYGFAFMIETQRNIYINDNKDSQLLELPKLPFEDYMQVPNPVSNTFRHRFKLFYGIGEDVELNFIPYNSWFKKL